MFILLLVYIVSFVLFLCCLSFHMFQYGSFFFSCVALFLFVACLLVLLLFISYVCFLFSNL